MPTGDRNGFAPADRAGVPKGIAARAGSHHAPGVGELARLYRPTLKVVKRDGVRLMRMLTNSIAAPDDREAPQDALMEQMRSENEYLRAELSRTLRQLAAERERADVLHREALGRIENLMATIGDRRELATEVHQNGAMQEEKAEPRPAAKSGIDAEDRTETPALAPPGLEGSNDAIVELELEGPEVGMGMWRRLRLRAGGDG